MKRLLFTTLFCVTVVSFASGQPRLTNGDLLKECQSANQTPVEDVGSAQYCMGFMKGWLQGLADTNVISVADGVTAGQMSRVFIAYMAKHPEDENKPAGFSLMFVLLDAKLVTPKPCSH